MEPSQSSRVPYRELTCLNEEFHEFRGPDYELILRLFSFKITLVESSSILMSDCSVECSESQYSIIAPLWKPKITAAYTLFPYMRDV